MTRSYVLPLAILASMGGTFLGGWSFGVWSAPRVNTVTAMQYAEALDLQSQAYFTRETARKLATCQAEIAKVTVDATNEVSAARLKLQETAEDLSERIIGLRVQLQAAGIPEHIEGGPR